MFSERESLLLAALLHDIGKFRQRAGQPLGLEDENLKAACLPVYNGNYSHYHALHSGKFVRDILGKGYSSVENLILYHHQPQAFPNSPRLAKIITLADWLSSGERHTKEEGDTAGNPRKDPLISIFSNLSTESGKSGDNTYFPLKGLQDDMEPCFPVTHQEEALNKDSYLNLWGSFVAECRKFNSQPGDFAYIYSFLLSLMEKYTLFIPSAAWQDKADLSLYHHSKSTAAIAACLYDLNWEESLLDKVLSNIKESEEPVAYLVGGDISGIQDFIYSVTSEKALKGLKGRSYYLQLLIEATAKTILNELNLPDSNIIFMGGGHFNLLLPAQEGIPDILKAISKDTNKTLLSAHNGQLAVIIDAVPIQARGFLRDKFLGHWNQLAESLARKKKQKLSELFTDSSAAEKIFIGEPLNGKEKRCIICSKTNQSTENTHCPLCDSFIELAQKLARAKSLQWTPLPKKVTVEGSPESWDSVLAELGWDFSLLSSPPHQTDRAFNSTNFYPGKAMVFVGSHAPIGENNATKTLDELANDAQGIKKWGILRADVDHLGKAFRNGLGEDRTISRVSMLSYLLNIFFTLQLQAIIKKSVDADKAYIIYSGGDDLCILGSWSVLPQLACQIREAFMKFTSGRLSISAGIYLAPSDKYPIYQAAQFAGIAVDKAKDSGRNRITFFEEPLEWNKLIQLEALKDKLVSLIEVNRVPRSLLSTLYYSQEERLLLEQKKIPMQRIWRVLYSLKRIAERNKALHEEILSLRDDFILSPNFIPQTEIAVRWADYLTRKDKKGEL
jgi:CRISPR-associated protein Csm1